MRLGRRIRSVHVLSVHFLISVHEFLQLKCIKAHLIAGEAKLIASKLR